jgi:myo-inositol-1(or 4)-monophosphatase
MAFILEKALDVAVLAAKAAAQIQLKHYNTVLDIKTKTNERDMVTNADMEADAAVRKIIQNEFPEHSIITEEDSPKKGSEYVWYVDPIDGTTNYTRRAGYFCVAIGLAKLDKMQIGVVYNVLAGELYTAIRGKGAFLNGKPIMVSKINSLGESLVCMDFGYSDENRLKEFKIVQQTLLTLNTFRWKGSGALQLCEVAKGSSEGYLNVKSTGWDYSAASLILTEAGGTVTDFTEQPWKPSSSNVLATNALIHDDLLNNIRAALK